jgi:hypothetical protein
MVYEKLLELLRNVCLDELSLPHLLIDIAGSLFTRGEKTAELIPVSANDLEIGGVSTLDRDWLQTLGEAESQTDAIEKMSQEVETDAIEKMSQEVETDNNPISDEQTQTAAMLQDDATSQTGPFTMVFSDTILLFERDGVNLISPETNEPLDPIDWNIEIKHWPFRRFTSFKRMPPTMRGTAVVPNLKTIATIIRFNAMPAPQFDLQKKQLLTFLKSYVTERLIILMSSIGLKMKGIYILEGSIEVTAGKIWGVGPQRVTEQDVGIYWKYLTGVKHFEPIPTKHFTQTTDCVCLKRTLEPRNW